jgi:amino acid transporter
VNSGRKLTLVDLLCLGVNAIVGSGIFLLPGKLAGLLGPASVLAFAVTGLLSALIALSFAEVSSRFDRSGGPYVYAREAFGGPTGYVVGWTCWAAAVMSWAAVTRGMMMQAATFYPALGGETLAPAVGCATIIALALINTAGVKPGAIVTDVLTVAKLLPLLVLLAVGVSSMSTTRLAPFAPMGFGELPRATFLAFFAFQGFEVVPVPAGDSARPTRDAPLAVLVSVVVATLLYMALQLSAVATTPGIAGHAQPLTAMAMQLLGPAGATMVALAALVSMLGFNAGVALAAPRYIEALSLDGYLPTALGRRHERRDTPQAAILATSGAAAVLTVVLDFTQLVDLSVIFVAVQYLSTTAAVPVLRARRHSPPAKVTLPAGPALPAAGFLAVAMLVALRIGEQSDGPALLLHFGALVAVGVVVALPTVLRRR